MYDLIIKNGVVFDGLGSPGKKADIGVTKGKISGIENKIPDKSAKTVIDALGKYVAPGFIDIQNHSDAYWTIFDQPEQLSLVSQGITTIITGNCGSSLAPLLTRESLKTVQKWHDLAGVNVDWSSFAEFLDSIKQRQSAVNVGSLVGHATLRRGLLGDAIREVSDNEIKVMDKLLSQALNEGALGLSLGLVYAHEVNSTMGELKELAANLKRQKKYLSIHLRSEGGHILESLEESIDLANSAGVALKISHMKIRGKKNWHLLGQVLNRMEKAYHEGTDISFDVYPYESSWSVLYTYLPKWAYEGGRAEIISRLAAPVDRKKILDYLKLQDYDFSKIVVAEASGNPGFVGKSITDISSGQMVGPEEAMLNLLSACGGQVVVFDHNLSPDHVEAFLTSPLSVIATDGAGYSKKTEDLVHPRCFGAMPRFLRMSADRKLMKWEDAIKKITSEPARIAGLKARGSIVSGKAADLVIFDPLNIADSADYIHPFRISTGIEHVIVNGQEAFRDQALVRMAGQVVTT